MAFIDKYYILRHTTPFRLRTFEFGLVFMKPLHLDVTIYFIANAVGYIKLFYYNYPNGFESVESFTTLSMCSFYFFMVLGVVTFLYGQTDLANIVRRKFEATQKNVQYNDVSMVFETTYLDQYPFGRLTRRSTVLRRSTRVSK
jgi:hypothetical protein